MFPHPPHRTRRAPLNATGSPLTVSFTLSGEHGSIGIALDVTVTAPSDEICRVIRTPFMFGDEMMDFQLAGVTAVLAGVVIAL